MDTSNPSPGTRTKNPLRMMMEWEAAGTRLPRTMPPRLLRMPPTSGARLSWVRFCSSSCAARPTRAPIRVLSSASRQPPLKTTAMPMAAMA